MIKTYTDDERRMYQKLDRTIKLRVNEWYIERLEKESKKANLTYSELIRRLIEKGL